jgi:hypothetical protein
LLDIEINPVSEFGSPTNGVVIRASSELEELTKLLSDSKTQDHRPVLKI